MLPPPVNGEDPVRKPFVLLTTVGAVVALSVAPGYGQTSDDPPDPNVVPEAPSGPTVSLEPGALQVPPTTPTLYFSLDDSNELYTLSTTDATPTLIGTTGVDSSTVGLSESPDPGQLYGSTFTDLSVISADGAGFSTAGTNDLRAEGLAYDPVNNLLYKIINEDFAIADQTTGATTNDLNDPPEDLEGLAWRRTDGKIYGYGGSDSSNLYAYTPGTDAWALVGDTGTPEADSSGLAYDPTLDLFYAIGEDGLLYRIDPDTAAATLIGDTTLGADEDGGGLAFLPIEPQEPTIIVAFTG
jgi:hypothetical protein